MKTFIITVVSAWLSSVSVLAQSLTFADINIRDPFILPDYNSKTYYMYRSSDTDGPNGKTLGGVEVFKSKDLKTWDGPVRVFTVPEDNWITGKVWAPEVHLLSLIHI